MFLLANPEFARRKPGDGPSGKCRVAMQTGDFYSNLDILPAAFALSPSVKARYLRFGAYQSLTPTIAVALRLCARF
jgi:hypothetical protein